MPIFTDPSKLTKAKLKEELIRFNVKLPPSTSKKQKSSLKGSSEQEVEETESEDDINSNNSDVESETVSFEEAQKETKEAMTINAEDLTDKELANELRSLGFTPGPIGTTTRRSHLNYFNSSMRKYLMMKRNNHLLSQDHQGDVLHQEEFKEKNQRPLTARTRGKPERSSPPASSENTSTTEEKSGGGLPIWVKLVILLLVAFFVYLVIVNMEPSADEKIPKSITEGT
ncbi:unnamed protein product [Mytilus edulis]|uniref:LEM domain-containing protein n=1 Tax=Mytilus edulis TaxID=6550 RepID=A0A8S3S4I4_MYTED|nr:unnamed protein product [Mytilus edulis]